MYSIFTGFAIISISYDNIALTKVISDLGTLTATAGEKLNH